MESLKNWMKDSANILFDDSKNDLRLGEGKDSASLAKFLITEDSSWITGQIIAVDGGRSKLS